MSEYRASVEAVRALVAEATPLRARVVVVSRGDELLLRVPGREVGHFPQSPTGLYAGHHPADGAAAVAHLDELVVRGAEFLVIPEGSRWWLEHYAPLRDRLGTALRDEAGVGAIYRVAAPARRARRLDPEEYEAAAIAPQVAALVVALLPPGAGVALLGPAVAAIDVGSRDCWRIPGPGPGMPVDAMVAAAEDACAAGARYLVAVKPDDPSRALDGRLLAALAARHRRAFVQRLAEGFAADG